MGDGEALKHARSVRPKQRCSHGQSRERPPIMGDGEALKHARCSTFKDAVVDRGERQPPIVGDGETLKHARCSTFKHAVTDRKARGGRRLLYVHGRSHGQRREAAADRGRWRGAEARTLLYVQGRSHGQKGKRRPVITGENEALSS